MDEVKIIILKVIAWVKAAPGGDGVRYAGGQSFLERRAQVQFVKFL
ncbi:MAG: hypothetical protein FWE20_09085 [Defluviitaleaceae bacterium]|nr:hypothetical protein [Defluviitaleaceae bacterium]